MTDEERKELEARFNSKTLTGRQKELEATIKLIKAKIKEMKPAGKKAKTVVDPDFPDLKKSAENAARYGFAHHVVHCIGDKGETEIYELLDYWYGLDKRKTRQSFVDRVLEYIDKERRAGYTLPCITPVKIKWINSWVNADSPIVRAALKSPTLRTIFGNDVGQLKRYVEFCEVAKNPSQMANVAVNTYDIPEEWRYKKLHDALDDIGLPVGNYNNWKTAIHKAAKQW